MSTAPEQPHTPLSAAATGPGHRRTIFLWTARLGLVVLAIIVPLALLEASLRIFGLYLPGDYTINLYREPHPIYGYYPIPSSTGWIKYEGEVSRVDSNSVGFREREIGYERRPGTDRIVVLGDSFVEGLQVPVEATLTRQIEARLNAAGKGPVEVINAGISGFGTGQEYLLLKHEVVRFRPDLIVLVFWIGNDVANNSYRVERAVNSRNKPYFVTDKHREALRPLPFRTKRPAEENLIGRLRRSSYLAGFLESGPLLTLGLPWLTSDTEPEDDDPDRDLPDRRLVKNNLPVFAAEPTGAWEEAWEVTEALLLAMQKESARAGAPFLLVYAPTQWEIYPRDWEELRARNRLPEDGWDLDGPARRLAAIAARRGIPYFDLRPDLREAALNGPRLYYRNDIHWNSAGHAVVARALTRAIGSGGPVQFARPPT